VQKLRVEFILLSIFTNLLLSLKEDIIRILSGKINKILRIALIIKIIKVLLIYISNNRS